MGLAKLIIRKGALGAESKCGFELLMPRCYDNTVPCDKVIITDERGPK